MPLDSTVSYIVDMTNVKESSGVNPKHQEPGDYLGKVKDLVDGKSKNDNRKLDVLIQSVDMPSATYRYTCTFSEASLWKLRQLLVAAGLAAPKKKFKLTAATLNKLIGKEIGMSLDDDEYEGKMRSTIVQVFPADDLPEEEEEPAPKKTTSKKKAAEPDDDEDVSDESSTDDEDEDLDELDIDDL